MGWGVCFRSDAGWGKSCWPDWQGDGEGGGEGRGRVLDYWGVVGVRMERGEGSGLRALRVVSHGLRRGEGSRLLWIVGIMSCGRVSLIYKRREARRVGDGWERTRG